jgi:putative peptidoglycan lipid II flippase
MVRNLLKLLHREFSGLHEAALLLGLSTLAAQFLALLRDRLLAATFGAGRELDIYYAAFRIPDIVFVSVASFVSITVLIPFIIERLSKGVPEETYRFLNTVLTYFCMAMVLVTPILALLMPRLVLLVAPGFPAADLAELVLLSRIMLLSPFLLGLSNLVSSLTQATHRFFIYALSPVLYNVGVIIGVAWLYPVLGLTGLAVGVIIGALLHFSIQLPSLWAAGFHPKFTLITPWSEIRPILLVMNGGSIAVFNLAFNLQSVPLAIVGVSYSVAAFPALTKIYTSGDKQEFMEQMVTTIRHILFWSITSTVFFIVLRAQIVRVILGAGDFNWSHTRLTAAALALFALSVAAQSLGLLFIRGYYAAGETRRPLVVNITSSIAIIFSSFLLGELFSRFPWWHTFIEGLLRVQDVPGTAVLMLPLAYSLGLLINICFFWVVFQKDFGRFPLTVYRTIIQSGVAAALGGVLTYELLTVFDYVFNINTFTGILLQGLLAGLGGVVLWLIALKVFNNKELGDIIELLKHKFWQRTPIASDQTGL